MKISKYSRRLTQIQKGKIRDLHQEGYSMGYIARKFRCQINTVWNNVFDLDPAYTLSEARKACAIKCSKLTVPEVLEIRELSHKNKKKYNAIALAERFGVSQTTILGVIRGKTFRWLGSWIRPRDDDSDIYLEPLNEIRPPVMSDLTPGPKKGSHKQFKRGTILKIANAMNLSPSSICRKIKSGKIKIKAGEICHKKSYRLEKA